MTEARKAEAMRRLRGPRLADGDKATLSPEAGFSLGEAPVTILRARVDDLPGMASIQFDDTSLCTNVQRGHLRRRP